MVGSSSIWRREGGATTLELTTLCAPVLIVPTLDVVVIAQGWSMLQLHSQCQGHRASLWDSKGIRHWHNALVTQYLFSLWYEDSQSHVHYRARWNTTYDSLDGDLVIEQPIWAAWSNPEAPHTNIVTSCYMGKAWIFIRFHPPSPPSAFHRQKSLNRQQWHKLATRWRKTLCILSQLGVINLNVSRWLSLCGDIFAETARSTRLQRLTQVTWPRTPYKIETMTIQKRKCRDDIGGECASLSSLKISPFCVVVEPEELPPADATDLPAVIEPAGRRGSATLHIIYLL